MQILRTPFWCFQPTLFSFICHGRFSLFSSVSAARTHTYLVDSCPIWSLDGLICWKWSLGWWTTHSVLAEFWFVGWGRGKIRNRNINAKWEQYKTIVFLKTQVFVVFKKYIQTETALDVLKPLFTTFCHLHHKCYTQIN